MTLKFLFLALLLNQILLLRSELLRAPQQPHFDYAFTKFRPPPSPPEPTFFQRVTNWVFPWGWSTEEEAYNMPAMSKIDSILPPPGPPPSLPVQQPQTRIMNTYPVRDTEPTTARTTRMAATKCSPCNKVPWIPMIPTYQLPVVKGNQQPQQQVYFKHHFGNESPYVQVPAANQGYKYSQPSTTTTIAPVTNPITIQDVYGVPSFTYGVPITTTTKAPPIKLQEFGHQVYGVPDFTYNAVTTTKSPPIKLQENYQKFHNVLGISPTSKLPPRRLQQNYGVPIKNYATSTTTTTQRPLSNSYGLPTKSPSYTYRYSSPLPAFPPATTQRINVNTIDTSVITFTTNRPLNRPLRFTSAQNGVTNPEYLLPPNMLPLEGENSAFPAPIPIPNLSPTPIPPLFDSKDFHDNPYTNEKVGFIKIVPLEPTAQLSNKVNVQFNPKALNRVEVVNSRLVAEFTIPPEIIQTTPSAESNFGIRQTAPVKINIDIGNNLDNINTTLSAPLLVASEEATDVAFAASEKEYQHNVRQELFGAYDDGDDDGGKSVEEQLKQDETNNHRVLPNNIESNNDNDEEDTTTTEGNYFVKFEPSIQTAADLVEETRNNRSQNNKNRTTPLGLLDSPIFYKASTESPKTTTPLPLRYIKISTVTKASVPPFKPMKDFTKSLATLWTAATHSLATSTESLNSEKTTIKPTISPFIAKLSGITIPREKPISSTKKPKQIQIIIPYTTINRPSPFKSQDEQDLATYKPFLRGHYVTHPPRNQIITTTSISTTESAPIFTTTNKDDLLYNAHGYHNDEEYQVAQESQIFESKVKIEVPKSNRHLTKIIANNIRDLLRKEKTPKPQKVDLVKLQRNIDGWTEQSFKGKASTMALFGHTKPIPTSFLTTTMRVSNFPSTTLSPMTTFDPDLMEETRKQYENILYKNDEEEDLYVKRHDRFLSRDNELLLLNNNLTQNNLQEGVKIFAPKATLSPRELWQRLHLTVSPLTNERVYVVTPQPVGKKEESTTFYKPRFAIRPTVAGKLFLDFIEFI